MHFVFQELSIIVARYYCSRKFVLIHQSKHTRDGEIKKDSASTIFRVLSCLLARLLPQAVFLQEEGTV